MHMDLDSMLDPESRGNMNMADVLKWAFKPAQYVDWDMVCSYSKLNKICESRDMEVAWLLKKKKRPRDLPEKLGKIRQLPIDSSDSLSLSVRSLVGIGHLTRFIWQLFNRYTCTIQHRWDCRIVTILQMCERWWRMSSLVNRCGDLLKDNLLYFCPSQVKLFNEKRSDLEEQQLHLNVGLQKIRETVDQVSTRCLFWQFAMSGVYFYKGLQVHLEQCLQNVPPVALSAKCLPIQY